MIVIVCAQQDVRYFLRVSRSPPMVGGLLGLLVAGRKRVRYRHRAVLGYGFPTRAFLVRPGHTRLVRRRLCRNVRVGERVRTVSLTTNEVVVPNDVIRDQERERIGLEAKSLQELGDA